MSIPQLAILLAGLLLPSLAAAQTYGLRASLGANTAFMQVHGNEGHEAGLSNVVSAYGGFEADLTKGRWGLLLGAHRTRIGAGIWAKSPDGNTFSYDPILATNHFLLAEGRYALLPTDRAWQVWVSAGAFGRWLANYRLGTAQFRDPVGVPGLEDRGEVFLRTPTFGVRYGLELVLPYRAMKGRVSYALSCHHWLGFSETVRRGYTFFPSPFETLTMHVSDRSHLLSLGISARWALN